MRYLFRKEQRVVRGDDFTRTLRIGSCAVTSRGMGTEEMDLIAGWIDRGVLAAKDEDEAELAAIDAEVRKVTAEFPAPGLAV